MEGTFEWVSGKPFDPFTSYENFSFGEPRGAIADEDYIGIALDQLSPTILPGHWHDIAPSLGQDTTYGVIELPFLVPEPGTLSMLASGLAGLALAGGRRSLPAFAQSATTAQNRPRSSPTRKPVASSSG